MTWHLAIALGLVPGCSLMAASTQSVTIIPSDERAEVYVDGNLVGTGRVSTNLGRRKGHSIIAKVGDRAGSATIGTQLSVLGALDIVGTIIWLVPVVGVFGPGFMELDTTTVSVAIPPEVVR